MRPSSSTPDRHVLRDADELRAVLHLPRHGGANLPRRSRGCDHRLYGRASRFGQLLRRGQLRQQQHTPIVTYNGQALVDSTGSGCKVYERSWTATDDCGNTAIHIQTITMADTLAPVITGGEDGQAECDGAGNVDELNLWLAARGARKPPTTAVPSNGLHRPWSAWLQGGETGSVTYVFTATDDCGNSASVDLTFHIVDTTPVASGSQDYDIVCGDYDENALYDITATDVCGGNVTIEIDSVNLQTGTCPIVAFRTYKLTDECGNISFYEQAVNLYDSIAPVLTIESCPMGDTLTVDDLCAADTSVLAFGMP